MHANSSRAQSPASASPLANPRRQNPRPPPRRALTEALEKRQLLSLTPVNPNSAIPFQQIVIDENPGPTPVVKLLVDITNNGKEDAVVGHETTLGGAGLDWYQYPASGNPNDPWIEHVIDPTADVYEAARATDLSGNLDSAGNPVNDLVVNERGTVYWYENPLGLGENPATAPWPKFLIGTVTQGATHELYLADLEGTGHLDVITNTAIFFPNYTPGQSAPTSWTRVANPSYNRTEKGLYLFDSGSGFGAIDLLGTGNAPNFQVGWYENPRDYGGDPRTDTWIFHPVGPAYGDYVGGDGVSYAAMDVNGDGREDIITCDGENGENPPYLSGGLIWWEAPVDRINGTWTEHVIDASITDVHNLVLADMNGDGEEDILAFEQDQSPQGRLMIIYNEGGTGQNWLVQTLASDSDPAAGGGEGGHNESVGDIQGDGDLDILTSPHGFYTGINPISVYMNELSADGIVRAQITSAPASQTIPAGNSVTFSVAATGSGPLVYQWELNGLDIPGANNSSYTISDVEDSDNGSVYRCIVSNAAGFVPSPGATLTVGIGPPQIITSPTPQSITQGDPVTFTTLATADGPLAYQWEQNGQPIPSATSSSFTINSVPLADNGAVFTCIVSDSAGVVATNAANLVVHLPPTHALTGEYFRSLTDTTPWLIRQDPDLDFANGLNLPQPLKVADIVWTGELIIRATGDYNFFAKTNGLAKVYIDGILVAYQDGPTRHTIDGSTLQLETGHKYDIEIKYEDTNAQTPSMSLLWNGPGFTTQILPSKDLYTGWTDEDPSAIKQIKSTPKRRIA